MELKVEYVDIHSISAYENNAKEHPAEQIEQIKKSIQEFGMSDPIGVWHDIVCEGHGRLIACLELGYETIPIIRLDHLTDEERKAYALVHNKLTMNSDFNMELLNMELEELKELDMEQFGFDTSDYSFDEGQLDGLFEDAEEKEKEPKQIQCPHCGQWFEA